MNTVSRSGWCSTWYSSASTRVRACVCEGGRTPPSCTRLATLVSAARGAWPAEASRKRSRSRGDSLLASACSGRLAPNSFSRRSTSSTRARLSRPSSFSRELSSAACSATCGRASFATAATTASTLSALIRMRAVSSMTRRVYSSGGVSRSRRSVGRSARTPPHCRRCAGRRRPRARRWDGARWRRRGPPFRRIRSALRCRGPSP